MTDSKHRSDSHAAVALVHEFFARVWGPAHDLGAIDELMTAGDRVVSRWVCTGRNNGIFGLPPDGRPVEFTGIAIWRVADGRLAECWAERAGLEAYRALAGAGGAAP